jgi:3-oxo-5-alpha-steroid 4-dehydrogenase 1
MEIVGPINLLYNLSQATPSLTELPAINQLVATLYCVHYANRAVISPFFSAPSMSPIHVFVMVSAMGFNLLNSSCLAGWLSGYEIPIAGVRTNGAEALVSSSMPSDSLSLVQILPFVGTALFVIGMAGNIYSETALFRFRREEAEKRAVKKSDDKTPGNGTNKFHKVYVIPPAKGVFRSILYPHYVFEWLEWTGFAIAGVAVFPLSLSTKLGIASSAAVAPPLRPAPWIIPAAWAADRLGVPLPLPAVLFAINAVANMLPHARWGRKWYVEKFGEKGVAGRGAVVPWCEWM